MSEPESTPPPVEPGLHAAEPPAPAVGPDADPRLRPPDPAGTQPTWDPDDLVPRRAPVSAAALAPGATEAGDDTERLAPGEAEHDDAGLAVAAAVHDPGTSKYSPRFQFALGALVAIGAAAVVLLVAVLTGDRTKTETINVDATQWSSWHPVADGPDAPTQIADHVGSEYRLPDGRQLVAVTGGPLEIAGLPVTVAVRQTPAQGGDIKLIDGNGVLFRLCGLGPKCSIAEGKPSLRRHLLLRREALELALYSFRYIGGLDEAVVFLPPRKGQDPSQAVFFQKDDRQVLSAVRKPLDATLVANTPSVSGVTRSPDAALVNDITTSKLFKFSFTQANQDARAFLVLDPMTS